MLDRFAPGFGRSILHAGNELQMRADVGASEDGDHARRRERARDLDRADAGMRNGTAHERNMQHAWEVNVGNEAAAAQEQPPILPPWDGSPDKAPCLRIHHSLMMPRTNLQASPCHYPTRHR